MPGGYKKIQEWIEENPEKAREVKRLANKKSTESKRKRKALREYLGNLLMMKTETGDVAMDMSIALIDQALSGNVEAYKTIRSTLGEDAVQQYEISSNNIVINIIDEDENKDE